MSLATSAGPKSGERPPLELPDKPRGAWKAPAIALVIVVITVVMCLPGFGIDVDFGAIARNWQNGAGKVLQLLVPDWELLPSDGRAAHRDPADGGHRHRGRRAHLASAELLGCP
ncbi:hypothetical protein QFZ46_000645 [Microbacterium murale]|uniref:Uncharacterized protein n=1 Tax=Microbacterium murale TaxID=1081040 RepID=A0ABU0P572_9MICO|nr:hypothetical protein [Microbacterium murale]